MGERALIDLLYEKGTLRLTLDDEEAKWRVNVPDEMIAHNNEEGIALRISLDSADPGDPMSGWLDALADYSQRHVSKQVQLQNA